MLRCGARSGSRTWGPVMQLEFQVKVAPVVNGTSSPRVLALHLPDLSLQRSWRSREGAGRDPDRRRVPVVVERGGEIVACDAEARGCGVRPGDTLVQAQAACASLEVLPLDREADRAALEGVAEAMLTLSPAIEIAGSDVLLLDASGARLIAEGEGDGEPLLVNRAVELAAELGFRVRAALANGRAPARALARHGHATVPVGPGDIAAALAPLPIVALELENSTVERLIALGIRSVGDLARLPVETLVHRFGAPGLVAWRVANGDDPSPLVPYVPERLPEERLDLEAPVDRAEPLLFGLKRLADRLAARLAGRGFGATRLELAIELDPSGEERFTLALARPSRSASQWVLLLRERLGSLRLPGAAVGASLSVSEAARAPVEQLAIGDRPEQVAALETVLARLTARLGEVALFAAVPEDRHRPEAAYRAERFHGKAIRERREERVKAVSRRNAPSRKASSTRVAGPIATDDGDGDVSPQTSLARPTRLLARPQPLLALGEGGRFTAVRFGGRTLRILSLSPVERLAGEWWAEPFHRDYHRAHVEGLGDCWLFRDAGDGRLWLHGFFD